jgi:hypothetical protein
LFGRDALEDSFHSFEGEVTEELPSNAVMKSLQAREFFLEQLLYWLEVRLVVGRRYVAEERAIGLKTASGGYDHYQKSRTFSEVLPDKTRESSDEAAELPNSL